VGTYKTEVDVPLSPDETMKACREALLKLNWRVQKMTSSSLEGKAAPDAWSAAVTVQATIVSSGRGSRVLFEGRMFGVGGIVANKIEGMVGKLVNALDVQVRERTRPAESSTGGLAAELERLATLRDRGVLTQAEFELAKGRLIGSSLS
jgi:hypothetical protein